MVNKKTPNQPILQYLRIPLPEQMTPTDYVLYKNKQKRSKRKQKELQHQGKMK